MKPKKYFKELRVEGTKIISELKQGIADIKKNMMGNKGMERENIVLIFSLIAFALFWVWVYWIVLG